MNTVEELEFSEFPILETKRLILREPVVTDAADFFVFQSDPYVQRYNMKPLKNVSRAEEMIERSRAIYSRHDGILWAVTLKGQDTVIGSVGFSAWSYHNRAMLGYDLALAYWGRGIGSEAVRAIIRFGFERMGLNRIEAETIEDNHESRRMLEKLEFTCEGIRRGYSLEDDGEYHGSAMYGLLRSEYNPTGMDG
ncbi:MAG: GNAT family N-acetyltransferase [Candidatus Promineifilaceae bacterium]